MYELEKAVGNTYSYDVCFELDYDTETRLAQMIHKMTALKNKNQKINGTQFIYDDSYAYLTAQ